MVDFAKMLADLREENDRRAGLSAEERAAEDAREDQERAQRMQVVEDRETFGNRSLRTVAVTLSGDMSSSQRGDVRLYATNEQGRLTVVLPGTRGRDVHDGPASAPLRDALQATEGDDRQSRLAATAEGFFKSRSWNKPSGERMQAWDFVATTVTFEHDGKVHTLGRALAQTAEASKEQPLAVSKKQARTDEAR